MPFSQTGDCRVLRYFLLCLVAAAQTANSQEIQSTENPATFKARVNLVLVPVVVRDSQGRAIGDLRQENFRLLDKGKPQEIIKFSVERPGSRAAVQPTNPGTDATDKPSAAELAAFPERFTAYLFDDIHLQFSDLARIRDAASRNLASLETTSRAAIFSTSGRTTLDFTDDRAKLNETLLRLQPRSVSGLPTGMECPNITYYMADLIQNKNDPQALQAGTADAMACLNLSGGQINVAQQAVRMAASRALTGGETESRIALGVLKDVIRRISVMPGQRTIVILSPGFLTPFAEQDKTELIDRAIRSNVIINAVDARGLYAFVPGGDASQRMSAAPALTMRYESDAALVEADLLAEMADGTGGTFFHNDNDLREGLRRLASAPEYVYTLGFSPQNLKLDGSFHRLKVTLEKPTKLSVQARRGYFVPRHAANPVETAKQEIQEALFSREEMVDLPVELHTQFFKPTSDSAKVTVVARVDVRQLKYRKSEGLNHNELTIVSALFDRNGNFITGIEKRVAMHLRDETLENKLRSGVTFKSNIDVKPGSYLVRLVVRDTEGQMMSAQNGALEIP